MNVLMTSVGVIALTMASLQLYAQEASRPTAGDGLYTSDQAQRGETQYVRYCAECHELSLSGGVGPALAGSAFTGRYKGSTLRALFEKVRAPMPPFEPPQPDRQEAEDILAYIMSRNGFLPGQQRLRSDNQKMERIVLEFAGDRVTR